jgi:hypothetical protein
MSQRARMYVGSRWFEVLTLHQQIDRLVIGCRPLGSERQMRGEDVASMLCKQIGQTGYWVPDTINVPAASKVTAGEKASVMMGMLEYATRFLGLCLRRPNYMPVGDRVGWARWDDYRQNPRFHLEVIPDQGE